MSDSLFSSSWYKVADLRVRLRNHVAIHRHVYRGDIWFILQDHVTGQFQRFTPQAHQLIGMMDGEKTLQQIWDLACIELDDDLPSQDQVIQLVGQLNRANVIQTDALPDIDQLHRRQVKDKNKKLWQQLKSPLSIRIPILDPEVFLHATRFIAHLVFSRIGMLVWGATVCLASVLAVINWEALSDNISDKVLGVENLILMALVYPLVKLVHELGHGYAVKRWGGEVHEMGVMLLIFIPVPYVDASAASSFSNKYQRMIVGAVGVLGELFMAALAMIIWTLVEPGIVRAMAFNVMLIGGVSTLLFNGNPLLRFDAYYVLADYLEIPNLANRGNAQVGYILKRYLFGVSPVRSNAKSARESWWLVCYSIAAYIYRLFVMVAISLFVASKYFVIGGLLAFWSVWTSLISPIFKVVSKPMTDPQLRRKKYRIYTISTLVCVFVLAGLVWVPVPYKSYAQGVLYVPQQAYVRAEVSGFLQRLNVKAGEQVTTGTLLAKLEDPELYARAEVLKSQLKEAVVRYEASVRNRTESDILLEELGFIEQEYLDTLNRLANLDIISEQSGSFVVLERGGIKGRYYQRGDTIGYVVDYSQLPLTVMIAEDDIDQIRTDTQSISLRLASSQEVEYSAQIIRQVPSTTQMLPSYTLATEGGGLIALDPARQQELQAYQSYFRLDLDGRALPKHRFDERVFVLFEHTPEPIALRWYRNIRRVFLRQFDV